MAMEYDPVEIFKALSNENRVQILKAVYEAGVSGVIEGSRVCCEECSCMGDMVQTTGLAPSTITHHTKELARAGLIKVERDGQFVRLLPNPEALEVIGDFAQTFKK
jgi:ArsR family transcriptional regulator, arsenate/arsenite/antimonite-responsive transcriptional repressor